MKRRGTICILLLGLILITATSCGGDDKETTSQQPAEADINVTITADGNIEASLQMGLTFGSGGKLDKIYVKEGDEVNKGDVLAKLDTSALELAVTQAKVAWAEAEIAVVQARYSLDETEYNLEQAKYNLDQDKYSLDEAEYNLDVTEIRHSLDLVSQAIMDMAEERVRMAEERVRMTEERVGMTEEGIKIAEQSLSLAEQSLKLAWQSVDMAQKQLDEATITAPFDGTVYKVGAKEGEFLSPAAFTGRTIVGIIDLRHMELVVSVDEFDIAKVKTRQKVMISVDAVPEAKLEGWVTFISPVASEPVGVVLFESDDEVKSYEVKIDFDIPEDLPIRAGMSATAEIIVE